MTDYPPGVELELTQEKMKNGETVVLLPGDQIVQADWDDTGKWCYLTILRRVRP
jgi:hypothetical protein